jgi:hypothetical protein
VAVQLDILNFANLLAVLIIPIYNVGVSSLAPCLETQTQLLDATEHHLAEGTAKGEYNLPCIQWQTCRVCSVGLLKLALCHRFRRRLLCVRTQNETVVQLYGTTLPSHSSLALLEPGDCWYQARNIQIIEMAAAEGDTLSSHLQLLNAKCWIALKNPSKFTEP